MVDKTVLEVIPKQINNAIVNDEQKIELLNDYTQVSIINDNNITLLLGIIFALLILISVMNWSLNLTRIGDKSS